MVVGRYTRRWLAVCAIVIGTTPLAAHDLSPRFGIAVATELTDPATRLVVDSVVATIQAEVPALYFAVTDADSGGSDSPAQMNASTPPAESASSAESTSSTESAVAAPTHATLVREAWDAYQAEIVIVLDVTAPDDEERRVVATYYRGYPPSVQPRPLNTTSVTVSIDTAGRYQRARNYETIVAAVAELVPMARPGRDLIIRSDGPFRVEGLPDYVDQTETDENELTVELRGLTQYSFSLHRPGHRSETRSVYLERKPLEVIVPLRPYPRHAVTGYLRNVSFPGIEYAYYPPTTRWVAGFGVTSFLVGMTPLRQLAHPDEDARIITSYGLTELEGTWQYLFRSRDRVHRFGAGAGAALRLVHGNVDFGIDPIVPGTLRVIGSWEWELPGRLTLTQRFASDLFISPRPEFFSAFPLTYKIGPIFWQLPVYRVGVRVRL